VVELHEATLQVPQDHEGRFRTGAPSVGAVLPAALSGLALGLSLIVAIGAQNAHVLRQGLRRAHVAPVVGVCVLSDAALIGAGVLGAGVLVTRFPAALTAVRIGGAVFLLGYAVLAARRALRPQVLDPAGGEGDGAADTLFPWR
jgi:L-lysine exporter family protein LysE/ArgO